VGIIAALLVTYFPCECYYYVSCLVKMHLSARFVSSCCANVCLLRDGSFLLLAFFLLLNCLLPAAATPVKKVKEQKM
jgi:hypothetical protein